METLAKRNVHGLVKEHVQTLTMAEWLTASLARREVRSSSEKMERKIDLQYNKERKRESEWNFMIDENSRHQVQP